MIISIVIWYFLANTFLAGMYYQSETDEHEANFGTFLDVIIMVFLGTAIFCYYVIFSKDEENAA